MSYQDFLKAMKNSSSSPPPPSSSVPSPVHTIHRKPTAKYSPMPSISTNGSVSKTVSQYNSLRSTSMPSPGTTPTTSMSKRSFSPIVNSSSVNNSPVNPVKPIAEPIFMPVRAATSSPSDTPTSALSMNGISDYPPPPAHAEWHSALKDCLAIQNIAVTQHNKRPFAAILLAPDKTTTLLSHNSISHVQHAESELARLASIQYSIEYLRKCTLVSTWEPCAMCAGTIYWSGIGRVVYAASEAKLKELTGSDNTENMTMALPCRTIFNAGQTKVEVVGPVPGWDEKVVEESRKWWKNRKPSLNVHTNGIAELDGRSRTNSVKSGSTRSYTVITNPLPDEGVLSRIGEDGEYKADLKVDWMN